MMERQKKMMRDENGQLVNNKRATKEHERSLDKQIQGTTPQAIGDGHSRQLAAMKE